MFGYVTPFKPDLKMREYEAYKSVYCGLCREMGKRFGPFARLTLSYDFAFLAMFELAVKNKMPEFENCRCAVNPLKKKTCAKSCDELDFSSSVAMIMLYYKVLDNIHDSSWFKKLFWLFLKPFAKSAHKKAAKKYPKLEEDIASAMNRQYDVEKASDICVDESADPTATALAAVCGYIDETRRGDLERFGYLLGRWVYLIDALDDLEKDIKTKNYNPFLRGCGKSPEEMKEYTKGSINATAAELQLSLEKLDIKVFRPIIYNVIYIGLADTLKRILSKEQEDTNGRSL